MLLGSPQLLELPTLFHLLVTLAYLPCTGLAGRCFGIVPLNTGPAGPFLGRARSAGSPSAERLA